MSSIVPDLELPILVVDKDHWQKIDSLGVESEEYTIKNYAGFRLSTHGYEFMLPENAEFKAPNIIQIVIGKEQLYATAFEPGRSLYTIDTTNLVPMYHSKRFTGFVKGQKIIIAIGHLSPPHQENPQPKFTILWVGVVNIQ